MGLLAGTRLGPYEITSPIGAGGMGEVYRARDPRIGRDVAIKVLPAAFSEDQERLRRFQQEAHSAGVLNHPNILAVYDVGTDKAAPYIVSELLDGETLRNKLQSGALSVRKAIEYSLQIAHGLAAAHEKGITHRDLKPENLFITKSGHIKILDFGLAKLTEKIFVQQDNSGLQTVVADSHPGTVLGTVGYMSPEQVRGQSVDSRSDIFSFGTILYEMFTGKRAFSGNTHADTMSSILQKDPVDIQHCNPEVPAAAERIVRHCLEKDPGQRFQTASDLAFALEALSGTSDPSTARMIPQTPVTSNRQKLWVAASIFCLLTSLVAFFLLFQNKRSLRPAHLLQLSIDPPTGTTISGCPMISPDGTRLIFQATDSTGRHYLWLRLLSALESRRLADTEEAYWPFWSPDSKYIASFAAGKLKKMQLPDGPPQIVCNVSDPRGGAWSEDGIILFAPAPGQGLYRVSSSGGTPTQVTQLMKGEVSHRYPVFLGHGHDFMFYVYQGGNNVEQEGLYRGSLDTNEKKQIGDVLLGGAYTPPSYLVFQQNTNLMAQSYDLKENRLKGDPIPLVDQVITTSMDYAGTNGFTATSDAIACLRGSLYSRLAWYDRSGKEIRFSANPGLFASVFLSGDDKRIAADVISGYSVMAPDDVWIVNTDGAASRLTFATGSNTQPVWNADGSKVIFASNRTGNFNLYMKEASGSGQDKQLLQTGNWLFPDDWSKDGRFVIFDQLDPKTSYDLWIMPLSNPGSAYPLLNSPSLESQGRFSPNGQYVSYTSDESGRAEIYVEAFPDASRGKWQISTTGGVMAQWSRDGKELFYVTPDRKLIAVDVSNAFPAVGSKILFSNVPIRTLAFPNNTNQYAVSADSQRFLIIKPEDDLSRTPITIIYNWQEMLKK